MRSENIIWKAKYLQKKNWLSAVKVLKEGIEEFPDNGELHEELGKVYSNKKLYKKAIEHYQKALNTSANTNNLNFKIGNAYLSLKKARLAINYYNKIEENFPEAMYNKAIALTNINKRKESIIILQTIVEKFPKTQIAYYFLVEQLLYEKRYKEAVSYLENAENHFGKLGKILFFKGLNYYYMKNWIKAYTEFIKAEKLKFDHAKYYQVYGLCAEKIGNTAQAIELLGKAINKDPFNSNIYIDLTNILFIHDRPYEALKIIKTAQKIDPSSILVRLTVNRILRSLGLDNENNS